MNAKKTSKQSYKGSTVFADGIELIFKFSFQKDIWGIREIAKELKMDKSKALRLLQTMEDKGLVHKTDEKKYKMGLKFWQLAIEIFKKIDYLNLALPIMEELSIKTKETIIFWAVNNHHVTFIHRINSNHHIQYLAELGTNYPVAYGATSKIIMAYMPNTELDKYITRQFKHFNKQEIDKLYDQINKARTNGYSIAIGERVAETAGIASAITNENGKVVAGISIAMPSSRYTPEIGYRYGKLLYEKVRKISLF